MDLAIAVSVSVAQVVSFWIIAKRVDRFFDERRSFHYKTQRGVVEISPPGPCPCTDSRGVPCELLSNHPPPCVCPKAVARFRSREAG